MEGLSILWSGIINKIIVFAKSSLSFLKEGCSCMKSLFLQPRVCLSLVMLRDNDHEAYTKIWLLSTQWVIMVFLQRQKRKKKQPLSLCSVWFSLILKEKISILAVFFVARLDFYIISLLSSNYSCVFLLTQLVLFKYVLPFFSIGIKLC